MSRGNTDIPVTPEEALLCSDCGGGGYEPMGKNQLEDGDYEQD
jgi:hypothetical protein